MEVSQRVRAVVAVVVALAAWGLFYWVREMRVHHAAIVAIAVGALVFTAFRTWERMLSDYHGHRRRWPPE